MKKVEIKENQSKKKDVIKIILNVIFWVGIILLAVIWMVDFVKIERGNEPIFCLSKKEHTFDDGTVNECIGLGYKIFDYNRESLNNAHQFSPFFIGMKK